MWRLGWIIPNTVFKIKDLVNDGWIVLQLRDLTSKSELERSSLIKSPNIPTEINESHIPRESIIRSTFTWTSQNS